MTALIGYNNAGKTNILMGIRWLLSPFSLDVSFFDDANRPVEVEGLFKGISENVLTRLGEEKAQEIRPFLNGDRLKIRSLCVEMDHSAAALLLWVSQEPQGKAA
jgi:predicted ATP-dependent endonuclease of OLD family